jgi:hypothetical protein
MERWLIPVGTRSGYWRSSGIGLICWALVGCVTPAAVKQASTQHGMNLVALATAAAQYRTAVHGYYDDLIAIQQQAYVAQHLGKTIEQIAQTQYASVNSLLSSQSGGAALTALPLTLPDKASLDFIRSATRIREDQTFWVRNFQLWLDVFQGADLAEKRTWLRQQVTSLAGASAPGDATRLKLYAQEAERTDTDLTYVAAALGLRRQAALLDQKLDRLGRQLKVMQAFHGVVDEYLSIDATIDAKAIAQAAAAGASLDLTGLPGLSQALSSK